ncbi:MAG: hypothetical protein WCA32_17130 [Chromatiaceae bacterium]
MAAQPQSPRDESIELTALVHARRPAGGFPITSGELTAEPQGLAVRREIELINSRRLKAMIQKRRASEDAETPGAAADVRMALDRLTALIRSGDLAAKATSDDRERKSGSTEEPSAPSVSSGQGRTAAKRERGQDPELALGQNLSELIRAADHGVDEPRFAVPPSQIRTEKRRQRRRARKVLDAAGVLLALGLAWFGFQWLAALPDKPADSPWALLGSARTAEGPAAGGSKADAGGSKRDAADSERPLGQFKFGPTYVPDTTDEPMQASKGGDTPADSKLTIRELEAAFNATYIPPPDCNDWASKAQMVSCGNHRMRALREFVHSGGKMSAAMLGGPIAPSRDPVELQQGDWRDPDTQGTQQNWREAQDLRQPETWRQEEANREQQDRQQDPYQDQPSGWSRGRAWSEPDRPPASRSWREAEDLRQPLTWQQEQARRDYQDAQGDGDRNQEQNQLRDHDWRLRYRRDSQPDWRADWQHGGSQEDHWRQDWLRRPQ